MQKSYRGFYFRANGSNVRADSLHLVGQHMAYGQGFAISLGLGNA